MTAGNERNDTPTFGQGGYPAARHTGHPAGSHIPAKRKTARWARKAVPAAAIAAGVAAGAAAYGLTGTSHSDPGKVAAALSAPLRVSNVGNVGAGQAAAAAPVTITSSRATVHAVPATAPRVSASRSARPTQAATAKAAPVAAAKPATAQATSAPAAKPTQTATASASTAAVTTFTCSTGSGMLPANATAIVNFLIGHGYSHNAAAGIAGNMYQESKGDPESVGMGGGGLIGFTPLPAGYVTGNPTADLQKQLAAVLTYNQIWASYLPALNAAATPAAAASIYVTDFERAGIPAASTREASADAVASACGL